MSACLALVPSDARQSRPKRKINEAEEVAPASSSFKNVVAEDFKMIKLSAHDLLANLTTERISLTNIRFIENGSRKGGTFADVAMATFARTTRNGQGRTLAVKKLRFVIDTDMTEEKFFRLFSNELHLLDKLCHPNIVNIVGFVEDMKRRIAWLVFHWEDNGNLREFLRSGEWEIPERVSLVQDVARGLDYLHTRQPPVCHGDLKSLNILVNSSHRALITDFGSARRIRRVQGLRTTSPSHSTASPSNAAETWNEPTEFKVTISNTAFALTGPAWSFRWAPPEVLKGRPPDLASDVWALGWIAWEAVTDCYPFEEIASEPHVTMKVIEGYLPSIYKHHQLSQIHMLCGAMQKCWKPDPKERPSATECSKTIGWIPNVIPVIKCGEQFATRSAPLLLQIGEIHRLQDRMADASKAFVQGLAIARATEDRATLAALLIGLALVYQFQSKDKEAEACYNEALALSKILGSEIGRANALLGLGRIQRARSKHSAAESCYTEALDIFRSVAEDSDRANALVALGGVRQTRSKYIEAESFLTEVLDVKDSNRVKAEVSYDEASSIHASIKDAPSPDNVSPGPEIVQGEYSHHFETETSCGQSPCIYQSGRNHVGQANALEGLGDVQRARSPFAEAEESYMKAFAIYRIIGDDLGQANALLDLGNVQRAQCNNSQAEASLNRALAIYQSIGNELGTAHVFDGLGHVQRTCSKYIEAEESFRKALSIFCGIGYNLGRANALVGLGHVQRERFMHTQAEASLTEALAMFECIGNERGQANSLIGIGRLQGDYCNYAEAEASYRKALTICESIEDVLGRASALNGLGHAQCARSKYAEAEASYTDALAAQNSIGDDLGRANTLSGLASVQRKISRDVEAEASLMESLAIYTKMENDLGRANSSLELAEVRLHQNRYAEGKILINDAARISEQCSYTWAKITARELLEKVADMERSLTPPSLLVSPNITHVGI